MIYNLCLLFFTEKMSLVYYKTLLPEYLRNSTTRNDDFEWEVTPTGNDLELQVPADNSDWERIFRMKLVERNVFEEHDDITVKLRVGMILPEPQKPRDPMSYMISDRNFAVGFQIMDPNHDYAKVGPYQAVEGTPKSRLKNPELLTNHNIPTTTTRNNPDVFEIMLKPSSRWGSVYCAIDDGHKIVSQYSDRLDLSNGLYLETYRYKAEEEYRVNYIEVSIYKDNFIPLQNIPKPTTQ